MSKYLRIILLALIIKAIEENTIQITTVEELERLYNLSNEVQKRINFNK